MPRLPAIALLALSGLLAAGPTMAQPQFVVEVNPGSASAAPRDLRVFSGQLYFTASRPDVGRELFRFDGQYAALASDIAGARAVSSDPATYVVHKGALYFVARNSLGHNGLWRFDGRTTDLIFAGSDVTYPVSYDGRLYFVAEGTAGPRVWYWDGRDNFVVAGIPVSPYPARHLRVFQNQLYFSFNDGTGRELWRFDGQRAERATDLNDAQQETGERGTLLDFRTLRVYQNRLYFTAPDLSFYRFDGSQATRVLGRAKPGEWGGSHGGLVFFRTMRQVTVNGYVPDTLWALDGTQPRALLPLWGSTRVEAGYEAQAFVPFRRAIYYRSQQDLWRFTGTHFERVSSNGLLGDGTPGGLMAPFRGRLFVAMPHQSDGNDELYQYDATGPIFARIAAGAALSFNVALLDAEAAALEAGIDLSALTATDDGGDARAFEAVLASANPTRGAVQVRLTLPAPSDVRVSVHDVLGRTVATLTQGALPAGPTLLTWPGEEAGAGVYIIRIATEAGGRTVPVVRM